MTQAASPWKKAGAVVAALAAVAVIGGYAWQQWNAAHKNDGLVGGNGRIEATEVDVATKYAGRISEILVREGDFVKTGQPLARMQVETLQAQRREAEAGREQARQAVAAARAQVALRESEYAAARAQIVQREADLDAARRRAERSEALAHQGAMPLQELDDNRARVRGMQAALAATQAQAQAARAAIEAARTQVESAQSAVKAAEATVQRIAADLEDSQLAAPRDGRVQLLLAQPGEVLAGGGKVLNLVDLTDVYMSFFLPETVAGRVALGSEVRIVLDAAPQYVIPATVSFVASTAQFTPKTVETASERQKLMFRVKARIAPELLQRYVTQVKTGVPGQAWLKLDDSRDWPAHLQVKTGN